MAEEERDPTAPGEGTDDHTPMTQQLGRIAVIVILVLFAIFAIANSQSVSFSWLFGETQVDQVIQNGEVVRESGGVPLIVLLVVSFVLGAIVGWFSKSRTERRRGQRAESES